jgi:serine-type D-Ala-D-Ala carboxypeptidase/endopeptidase
VRPSSSKSSVVAGTLILQAVGQGLLTLDSTTAQVLGWTGARGTITLRHLLSFTSGLVPEAACVLNPLVTLAACVDAIRDDPSALAHAPGTRFDYGSTHLHVAARMVEVASGTTWNARFAQQLRTPLGLPAAVTYYTLPQQAVGLINPFVAGGLWASVDDYAPILAISFHRGSYRGTTWAPAALFDAQATEPYPGVTIGNSPAASMGMPFRYGLAAWLECATPATGCTTLSSTGAFGFTPWVDRSAGYYAILGMYGANAVGNIGAFSVRTVQSLQPEIRRAIAQ